MWRLKEQTKKIERKWKWFCENLLYIHNTYTHILPIYMCVYCIFFLAFKNRFFFFVFFLFNACVVAIVVVGVGAVSAFSTCCKSSACIRNVFVNVLVVFWFCGALETAARERTREIRRNNIRTTQQRMAGQCCQQHWFPDKLMPWATLALFPPVCFSFCFICVQIALNLCLFSTP